MNDPLLIFNARAIGRVFVMTCLACVCLPVSPILGATVYVDKANASAEDGTSWATAWNTIAEGITDISNRNQIVQGGHLLWVNSNTYNESVLIAANLSGTPTDYNTFLANGPVLVDNAYPFRPNASYIVIDGFEMTGNALGAIYPNGGGGFSNSVLRNCSFTRMGISEIRVSGFLFFANLADGLLVSNCVFRSLGCGGIVGGGNPKITIKDCIFYDVQGWGLAFLNATAGARMTVTNCIFAGTGSYALYTRDPEGEFIANNNLIWGSGSANVADDVTAGYYQTQAEIDGLSAGTLVFSNNIVANPGFADLWTNWNFNCFYSNSPCIKENNGFDRNIGPYQNPALRHVSNNTYYVKTGGDDGANGLSIANAWATLGKAVAVAGPGDTVRVQPGTYAESVLITNGGSGSAVATYVADGDVTVDGTAYGIKVGRAAGVVLDGFKATGSSVGVYLEDSPGCTVKNCSLYENSSAGLRMDYSADCLLDSLNVYSNTSFGVYSAHYKPSGSMLSRSTVYANQRGVYIGTFATGWVIENCNIYSNSGDGIYEYLPMYAYYQISYGGIPAKILNCDITGNTTNGIFVRFDTPAIENCIISGNDTGMFEYDASSDAYLSNNCFYLNTSINFYDEGTTARNTQADINAAAACGSNIVADPGLISSGDRLFLLAPGSPCIDAGVDVNVAVDFFGRSRPVGAAYDIGSYEMPAAGSVISCW